MNKKIKVSDFVANYLASVGVKHVHILMGGGAASLNDSFCKHPNLKYICYNLENYGSYAAFGEAKLSGKISVFNSTSGIGTINTIPGILSAWGDGVPLLVVAGNTALKQTRRHLKNNGVHVHHHGIQDNDIVENVKSITKYAVSINSVDSIKYELEKCVYYCTEGRPGPCLIEIPSDISNSYIEEESLSSFVKENKQNLCLEKQINQIINDLQDYQRPLVLVGGGIRQSNTVEKFKQFIEKYEIPYVNTFLSVDLLPYEHYLNWGNIGVKGKRSANFALQNCNLLLILGCSLQTAHLGYLTDKFAHRAKKIQIDSDNDTLIKNIVKINMSVNCDLNNFFNNVL
jgi:acetolactate synthase-1/2/3 large subunit